MKTRLIIFSLLCISLSLRCVEEDKTRDAWKKVNSALDQEKIEPEKTDSLNPRFSPSSYELANKIKRIFKTQRTMHSDKDSIQLSSLKEKIFQIQGMPNICRQVTSEVLKAGDLNFYTIAQLDSAEAIILDCVFTNMVEN